MSEVAAPGAKSEPEDLRVHYGVGAVASVLLLVLPLQPWVKVTLTTLEAVSVVALAWSVWLLAKNKPAGWVIGLVGVAGYAVVFYDAKLYAEVGIQGFYFVTSLQAIYLWRRGNAERNERPVGRVPVSWIVATAVVAVVATLGLRELLIHIRGAAPFWDALSTVLSLIAHLYLMGRFVESWYVWIAVDTIYVPLYASRELYLTSALYCVFWLMAVYGLVEFRRLYREQSESESESESQSESESA